MILEVGIHNFIQKKRLAGIAVCGVMVLAARFFHLQKYWYDYIRKKPTYQGLETQMRLEPRLVSSSLLVPCLLVSSCPPLLSLVPERQYKSLFGPFSCHRRRSPS